MINNKYNDFIKFKVNENNLDRILIILPGILAEIVLTKNFFSKNPDLRPFTEDILLASYRDYLFGSRTQLYARIIKDLFEAMKKDQAKLIQQTNNLRQYIESYIENPQTTNVKDTDKNGTTKKDRKSTNVDMIDEWRKIIDSD